MGKRLDWEFRFTAETLMTACAERILYHEKRVEKLLGEWSDKNERRIELLSGSTALIPVYPSNTPGTSATWQPPMMPPEMQQLTNEMADLRRRIDDHQMKLRDYRDWRHLLGLDLHAVYFCTYEDVAYFFDHIGNQDGQGTEKKTTTTTTTTDHVEG